MINFDLKQKIAIVTGGAQGFGLAISKKFIESGATVISWDIDIKKSEESIKEINSKNFSFMDIDVTNYEKIEKGIQEVIKIYNKIDIFVNNAGFHGINLPTWEYPLDDWEQIVKINLTSTFYCCKAVIPQMIKNNYGRIVNITSNAGKEGNPNAACYSSAKAGAIALTKSLGKELADKNIAVNCVTPAAAKTRIFDTMKAEFIEYMLKKIPRNRFAKVEELASLVAWLASEENSFSTAAAFDMSGGRATY
jgi:3-oxoacyl-[acyl-carrier protein] reductase